jgi:D-sedoheptulose 7-phosphate isomerase
MKTASQFAKDYLNELNRIFDRLPLESIGQIVQVLEEVYHRRGQIFVIGNGGSAATASHMMNDLSKGTLGHNPDKQGSSGWPRFRAISLTDNVSLMTAWANDTDYNHIFSEPLKTLAQRDDVLIAISASGNSPNIIAAVEAAKAMGMKVIGLTGFGGGKLAGIADVSFIVPSDKYGPVEDIHMILDHIITSYFHEKLKQTHTP